MAPDPVTVAGLVSFEFCVAPVPVTVSVEPLLIERLRASWRLATLALAGSKVTVSAPAGMHTSSSAPGTPSGDQLVAVDQFPAPPSQVFSHAASAAAGAARAARRAVMSASRLKRILAFGGSCPRRSRTGASP